MTLMRSKTGLTSRPRSITMRRKSRATVMTSLACSTARCANWPCGRSNSPSHAQPLSPLSMTGICPCPPQSRKPSLIKHRRSCPWGTRKMARLILSKLESTTWKARSWVSMSASKATLISWSQSKSSSHTGTPMVEPTPRSKQTLITSQFFKG